jgi:hypothetical protein
VAVVLLMLFVEYGTVLNEGGVTASECMKCMSFDAYGALKARNAGFAKDK